jgi:sugar lactone lactonase YvrE
MQNADSSSVAIYIQRREKPPLKKESAMKVSQRIGLMLFFFIQLGSCGFAQSGIIRTSVVDGMQAINKDIGWPDAIAADNAGGFYFSLPYQNIIYRVAADGSISLIAGIRPGGFSGDGGPATAAQLNFPMGVAVDLSGNLYIADFGNNRIRKITTAGIITTVAGNDSPGFSGDGGLVTAAQLSGPQGVAVDSVGNIYIVDTFNHRIRKVTPAGIISTVAGKGTSGFSGDDGPATAARLSFPRAMAVDSAGNLYISDGFNDRIRKVTPAGIISTVAGKGPARYSGDKGRAIESQITPTGVAVDSAENLFIADTSNNRIRKVTPAGIISTVAGKGTPEFSGDGGAAITAQLNTPRGLTIDSAGNLFITDSFNNRIRKVTPAGIISTVAGKGGATTGKLYKLSDFPPLGFTVFGGAGIANQSGNATHGGIHWGADFEVGNLHGLCIDCEGERSGIPIGFLFESGYAGPTNNLGNGSALISTNYLAEWLATEHKPLTAFTTVGYTRIFGTGNALNFGGGINFYNKGTSHAVRLEVRDYFRIATREHSVAFRVGIFFCGCN